MTDAEKRAIQVDDQTLDVLSEYFKEKLVDMAGRDAVQGHETIGYHHALVCINQSLGILKNLKKINLNK